MHRIFRVKAYEKEHGPHFNEEYARKAVMKMENEDGTRGPHWSLEETTTLASQYGIALGSKFNRYDWFVALNKEVSMWPNFFTGLPFLFPSLGRINYNTLPVTNVTVGTEAVTLELPNHAFRNRDYVGGFYIDLRTAIPTGTSATLPILIGTNGDTRPLVTYNNEPVRVENLAGTGIYLLHYNKYTNQVFLVSGGYKATATPSA